MPMMCIRHMGVGVLHGFMSMPVAVRAAGQHVMFVQMVPVGVFGVVTVGVLVL